MGYYTTNYEFPSCNHTVGVESENIGYTRGITDSGVPFEAEMISDEDSLLLVVIMPDIFKGYEKQVKKENKSNLISFTYSVDSWDDSVLDIGMVDGGEVKNEELVHAYVEYLENCEIISFASNLLNGAVMRRVDNLGNDLVKIIVTMTEVDDVWAYTDLDFKPFIDKAVNGNKIVSFSNRKH